MLIENEDGEADDFGGSIRVFSIVWLVICVVVTIIALVIVCTQLKKTSKVFDQKAKVSKDEDERRLKPIA